MLRAKTDSLDARLRRLSQLLPAAAALCRGGAGDSSPPLVAALDSRASAASGAAVVMLRNCGARELPARRWRLALAVRSGGRACFSSSLSQAPLRGDGGETVLRLPLPGWAQPQLCTVHVDGWLVFESPDGSEAEDVAMRDGCEAAPSDVTPRSTDGMLSFAAFSDAISLLHCAQPPAEDCGTECDAGAEETGGMHLRLSLPRPRRAACPIGWALGDENARPQAAASLGAPAAVLRATVARETVHFTAHASGPDAFRAPLAREALLLRAAKCGDALPAGQAEKGDDAVAQTAARSALRSRLVRCTDELDAVARALAQPGGGGAAADEALAAAVRRLAVEYGKLRSF
jgi:hypothetical protein